MVSKLLSLSGKKGVKAEYKVLEGSNVADSVISYAKEIDADLIMIMTQQEMKLTDYVMGTTAMRIVNRSEIPVLSLRPTEKKDMSYFAK